MNHSKVLYENESLITDEKEALKETTLNKSDANDSPLNSWFRQQGGSKTLMPLMNQNRSTTDTRLKRTEANFSKLPQIENSCNQKKRAFINYESSFSSIPNINDQFSPARIQTPKLSSYYLK